MIQFSKLRDPRMLIPFNCVRAVNDGKVNAVIHIIPYKGLPDTTDTPQDSTKLEDLI